MSLRDSSYQQVSLDSVVRVNDDGTQSRFVFLSAVLGGSSRSGGLTAELTVRGPDGKIVPSPEPAISQSRLKLAQQNPKVREALTFWRGCKPGDSGFWVCAYKIYEIIREDLVGESTVEQGKEEIIRKGWATRDEIRNFAASANNRAISGDKARHAGNQPVKPGITPLNEGEAVAFIRRLLGNWFAWNVVGRP